MPFKGWDEPNTTKADAHKKGYCTHANPLFPVWHRPYLMLLEVSCTRIHIERSLMLTLEQEPTVRHHEEGHHPPSPRGQTCDLG